MAPPRQAAPVVDLVPPCPDSILPDGDPLASAGFDGKPVVRVCVVGGSEVSRKSAGQVALLRAGDALTSARVRADLGGLMKLGVFQDASAFGLRTQGGSVVVLYAVRDRPRVADIAFQGAKVFGDAALSAKLTIATGNAYDPAAVTAIAHAIRDAYHERGYGACRVVVVAEPAVTPPGAAAAVSVRIKVDEGPQWRLSKLDFRGNKKVSEAELRKAAGLTVGQPFVQDEIDHAVQVLSSHFYDRGFVAVRVDLEQGAGDATGNVPLTFVIDEGDVHTIRALHVTQLGASLEKEILEKVVRARPKQVFSRSALVQDIARVKAFFAKRGQEVEILPQTEIDTDKHTIDVTLAVEQLQLQEPG